MTKVIILGEPAEKKEGKKIEFVKLLTSSLEINEIAGRVHDWKNIELICKNYDEGDSGNFDLMFAYDDNRSEGTLYLGHFNDGIV